MVVSSYSVCVIFKNVKDLNGYIEVDFTFICNVRHKLRRAVSLQIL